MFTQKLSMDCTQEQYEKYLKNELLKMGYVQGAISHWGYTKNEHITNYYDERNGEIGNIANAGISYLSRTYLGKFNAPLFLALAAMREGTFIGYHQYTTRESDMYLICNYGVGYYLNSRGFHISTVSEIMAKFGEQPQKDIYITLAFEKEPIWENCEKDIEEYEAIHLLKTKGYRIFKQNITLKEV